MEHFWQIFVSFIAILIGVSIVSNKIKKSKIRRETEKIFPRVADHIQVGKEYTIFLSHGKTITRAKVIGLSASREESSGFLPFPLSQWLIVEKNNGKKAYLKPESIRYYEEADEE